ncbi:MULTISPECIES: DUF2147 domain-containing protein [unclassified Leisingera]|uniref:DUF2147 domain-containing protein n=1 Tax=unclassified Leisingera TaxID=2614906 RepID=UPI0002FAD8D8|nr:MULTISPECIES: DUF2147 domain-containing protein [unclassified Leisingera]KIC25946.1 imidazoleglycerol-phosphate dehydratase [Leisingera sp. ANG-S3]KIC33229.1 imidazoleglycerol-phosphate dehydratase [Leisingera sp. ANG-S5]KIC53326.1 imidazoleglycerol-phosphate dehydratase [Leisingera sp. ANG-S]KID08224.1 imidazoleglycerol-phosphate dehydratase [Leisingera sp. ANG1]
MKHLLAGIAVALGLAGAAAADPVLGVWKTEADDGSYAHIQMAKCGAAVCGKIARTFNSEGEYKSPNIGKTLVIDMVPNGDGSYEGKVWRPSNDKIYTGKMDLSGSSLALRGCVAGGLICSKQTWTRVQ